jgi:prepilin-type N-terminal cleavage/methylation domain-containing protein
MSRELSIRRDATPAFSLIELLVVIGLIAVLATLLIPALAAAKERARRSECLNNARQFILSCHVYANDHDSRLPVPGADVRDQNDTHTPVFGTNNAAAFFNYSVTNAVDCPNLRSWMKKPGWRRQEYGIAIGYHYLGGHPGTPWDPTPGTTNTWISPQTTADDPKLKLVADLNVYCGTIPTVVAPHGKSGAVVHDGRYYVVINQTGLWDDDVVKTGGQGGNIGLLDGSVSWQPISKLKVYKASHFWDTSGAYGYW